VQFACRSEIFGRRHRSLLPQAILRGQWDFRGFVLSDYGATHSVHALLSGQDQEYPGTGLGGLIPSYFTTELKPLVDPTSTSYDPLYAMALQDAVARVLYAYERFGLLECASPAGPVAGCAPPPRPDINDLKNADAGIVERLSEEAAVLLKNDGAALPLQGAELASVAVIGPTARQTMVEGNRQERARVVPRAGCHQPAASASGAGAFAGRISPTRRVSIGSAQ
jgi:beta-glucosidase